MKQWKLLFWVCPMTLLLASAAAASTQADLSPGNRELLAASGESPSDEGAVEGAASIEEELYFSKDEMITGPGKRAMKLGEAPANVFVITQEEIIQSGAHSLAEILRRVPGLDAVYISSAETQVSLRGFAGPVIDGQRISVLIDGRIFYHDFLSSTIWAQMPVPLSDIKRVEVIKGPMSALYGNKALLGIINIVTYEPEETPTELMGGGGQYYLGAADFKNAGKFHDGYWYKVTGNYLRFNQFNDTNLAGSDKAEEVLALTGKFLAAPTDKLRASLTGGFTQSFGLVQFGALSRWDERRGLVDSNFSYDFDQYGKLDLKAYWERHYISSRDYTALGTIVVDLADAEARHSVEFEITPEVRNTLTSGFEYRYGDPTNQPVPALNTFAGYLQDELRLYDKVILTGGFRADYQWKFAGLNTSAFGSAVWLAHPIYTFRVGFGSSFNAPNYLNYYANAAQGIITPGRGTLLPNRNLTAERILYLDVGNTIMPIKQLTIHADFFWYRLTNMIQPSVSLGTGIPAAMYINDGGAQAIGGEIALNGEITKWLEGYANWSYEHFAPIDNNAINTPNMGNPTNKANAGLRAYFFDRRLSFNVDYNFIYQHWCKMGGMQFPILPNQQIGSSHLLNIRVAYWPILDHLELAVAANNVLNDETPQVADQDPLFNLTLTESPRFNVWGSVRYVF